MLWLENILCAVNMIATPELLTISFQRNLSNGLSKTSETWKIKA